MAIEVAEYLGVRTDKAYEIKPINASKLTDGARPEAICPFKNSQCNKTRSGNKPVCSIRDTRTKELWIVCSHRLCSSQKGSKKEPVDLGEYQKGILHQVAKQVFSQDIPLSDVLVKREVSVNVSEQSNYSADYVMWRKNPNVLTTGIPDRPVVLEMQGGGETTNTGVLTKHIATWEKGEADLRAPVKGVAPLETNAWRRQQEQFLVKGNISALSGGRMVFCIGSKIYDYLMPRLQATTVFPDLKEANWTLALLVFKEADSDTPDAGANSQSIPLVIDGRRTLFTNYSFFVQAITNQAMASNSLFADPWDPLA